MGRDLAEAFPGGPATSTSGRTRPCPLGARPSPRCPSRGARRSSGRRRSPSPRSSRTPWRSSRSCSRGVAPAVAAGHSLGEYAAPRRGRRAHARGRGRPRPPPRASSCRRPSRRGRAPCRRSSGSRRGRRRRVRRGRRGDGRGLRGGELQLAGADGDRGDSGRRSRAATELLKARGARTIVPLPVSAPFHCAAHEARRGSACAVPRGDGLPAAGDPGRHERGRRSHHRPRGAPGLAPPPDLRAGAVGRVRAALAGLAPSAVEAGPGRSSRASRSASRRTGP